MDITPNQYVSAFNATSKARHARTVAIIGRGYSGVVAACAQLRHCRSPLHLWMIDPEPGLGAGIAYGTNSPLHLLNIRAGELTIDPARPGDFVDWARSEAGIPCGSRVPYEQLFLPRRMVQQYAADRFMTALQNRPDCAAQFIDGHVRSVERLWDGYQVSLGWGSTLYADIVIAASGYGAKRSFRFGADPFGHHSRAATARSAVLIGSGLTMVDSVLSLRRSGYQEKITVISRHGLMPARHSRHPSPPVRWTRGGEIGLRQIVRRLREDCARADAEGAPWQAVLNGVRQEAQEIWQSLDVEDQSRFFRHVRPFWETVRHRAAPDTHQRLEVERRSGSLSLRAGRVLNVWRRFGSSVIRWRPRGSRNIETMRADYVVDCSGHVPDMSIQTMFESLIASGDVGLDAHNLGLRVAPDGQLLSPQGMIVDGLFALGPLGRGSLLEITAAAEIGIQADHAARAIARMPARQAL